jgi:hypothetical protein
MAKKLIDQEVNKEIEDSINRMKDLVEPYYVSDLSLVELEHLKRTLLGELQYLTSRMGAVKQFKTNNTYFEEHRKRLKSLVWKSLMSGEGKVSATAAESRVYSEKHYINTLSGINLIKERYIQYEDQHKHFIKVLDCIVQSISVAGKELSQNI